MPRGASAWQAGGTQLRAPGSAGWTRQAQAGARRARLHPGAHLREGLLRRRLGLPDLLRLRLRRLLRDRRRDLLRLRRGERLLLLDLRRGERLPRLRLPPGERLLLLDLLPRRRLRLLLLRPLRFLGLLLPRPRLEGDLLRDLRPDLLLLWREGDLAARLRCCGERLLLLRPPGLPPPSAAAGAAAALGAGGGAAGASWGSAAPFTAHGASASGAGSGPSPSWRCGEAAGEAPAM